MRATIFRLAVLAVFLTTNLYSQSLPSYKSFNFQGFAIDSDEKAIVDGDIEVTFRIYSTSGSGDQYIEKHTVKSDQFGVFHALIGDGTKTPLSQTDFDKINFSEPQSLEVQVKDALSAGNPITISNGPLAAVPYARNAENGVPVGTILPFGGPISNIPDGWLPCDGSQKSTNHYPQLFAVISYSWGGSGNQFRLPDLRGRFLRGVDEGQLVDPDASSRTELYGGNTGDAVGTYQNDTLISHSHSTTENPHTHANGNFKYLLESTGGYTVDGHNSTPGEVKLTTKGEIQSTKTNLEVDQYGGSESRPVNAAVYYIIKY